MSDNLQPHSRKASNFLKHFRKDGFHNLVAIDPVSEEVIGITRPNGHEDIAVFIDRYNGIRNLYYSVNEPKPDAPDNKLAKHHIGKIQGAWLDADPKKGLLLERERERLLKFAADLSADANPPTYITDSGGGIQAFWLFDEPLDATKDNIIHAESLSRGLAEQYGTDFVQNIDRIMRIPFTINIPSEKKVKAGRTRSIARVIHAESPQGRRYPKLDFIVPSFKAKPEEQFEHTEVDMEVIKAPLPDSLVARLKETLDHDQKAYDLYYGLIEKPSRSEYDFTLTQQLVLAGYSLQDVAHILWHYAHGKNTDLTKREIVRAYNRVDRPFEGLDPGYIAQIEAQTNPILAARAAGKAHPDDLKERDSIFEFVDADTLDWKSSGLPVYKNFLYQNAITVIYGQSNVGKSFVAADIAGHIALGRNWGNFKYKAGKPLGVAYICAEAGKSFGKRVKALYRRLNVSKPPFYVLDAAPNFAKTKDDAQAVVKAIQALEKRTGVKIGLVVVDTLATTFEGGNENSSEDMGLYISNMKYIQRFADTGVMIVHHSGKDQAAGARGHSSLRAATDTEIEVLSEKKGERYRRHIHTRKQREGENDIIIPFGLMVVELGKDEDGDVIDTCHVVLENDIEFESVVPAVEDILSGNKRWAYEALKCFDMMNLKKKEFSKPPKTLKAFLFYMLKDNIDGCQDFDQSQWRDCMRQIDTFIERFGKDEFKNGRDMFLKVLKEMRQEGIVQEGNLYQLVSG